MLHRYVVKASLVEEAGDICLPEAETLVTERQVACLYVNYKHAVDVDVDTFVAHYQLSLHYLLLLSVVPLTIFPNMDVDISNVKLVFPTDQEKPLLATILV